MAERGQRTRIVLGGVTAEVSLVKTSGKAREARHEVRRGDAPRPGTEAPAPVADAADVDLPRVTGGPGDPLGVGGGPSDGALSAPPPSEAAESEPIRHGVWLDDGTWMDLTDRLAEIDERTRLESAEVVCAVPSPSVPRERVRDARWVAAADPEAGKVLALLWRGLAATDRIALVRWTVRTNQALGALVPRRVGGRRALCLLDLEWSENMREPGPRSIEPLEVEVAEAEEEAALELVMAFARPGAAIDELRDERLAKRAELLRAARQGELAGYEPPPPAPGGLAPVAEAFAAAAAAAR